LENAETIAERLRVSLPDYMVPSQIHPVADWPLNANGKTDYESLAALLKRGGGWP
jgi:hypothetical protein